MSIFSERLKERRTKLEYTQKTLAEAVSCGASAITNLERGTAAPSARLLEQLCFTLECRPDYLMGWSAVHKSKTVPSKSAFPALAEAKG